MNHEHEHSRASSPVAAAPHHDALEPGQSSRSALLRKPDQAVASGLVQRKARDANGVTDGAEDAVAAASASSGSLLPDTIKRKFESSLGADLSRVRVHTGDASKHAADAVGAKAYTMGNDIHFGSGHYDPGSSEGQHLLAHEIAHTVQQSGGARRMQFKLDVSSPGDGFEHEADRAADAMIAGRAAFVSSASGVARQVLQREPSNVTCWAALTSILQHIDPDTATKIARLIQRYPAEREQILDQVERTAGKDLADASKDPANADKKLANDDDKDLANDDGKDLANDVRKPDRPNIDRPHLEGPFIPSIGTRVIPTILGTKIIVYPTFSTTDEYARRVAQQQDIKKPDVPEGDKPHVGDQTEAGQVEPKVKGILDTIQQQCQEQIRRHEGAGKPDGGTAGAGATPGTSQCADTTHSSDAPCIEHHLNLRIKLDP